MHDWANEGYGKQCVMSGEQQALADYVRRVIRDKRLSYRLVAARSGGKISPTTVSDIVNRRNLNLSVRTQAGLAAGLGVSVREVQAVMETGEPTGDNGFNESIFRELHGKFSRLRDERHRGFIMEMISMANRKAEDYLEVEEGGPSGEERAANGQG